MSGDDPQPVLADFSPSPAWIAKRSPSLGPIERSRICKVCRHPRGWHAGGRGGCLCSCTAYESRELVDRVIDDHRDARTATRHGDPRSSHDAAIRSANTRRHRKSRVLACAREMPGLRARDIARRTGDQAYDVRKSTAELRDRDHLLKNQTEPLGTGEELRWYPT